MPLDERVHAPNAQTVLFHLTLFDEFCEAYTAGELSAAVSCECLRDAAEELCRSLATLTFSSHEQAALVTALHQSEAAFRDAMPELHGRTGAARGFGALVELLNSATTPQQCFDRESRSVGLGIAQRFGRSLSAVAGSRMSGSTSVRSQ
jgi:hypothetical protein